MRKRNVKLVLLVELVTLIIVFVLIKILYMGAGTKGMEWFLDAPTFIGILLFVIPGLIVLGEWKDFWKACSVGRKKYGLLELKNILEAVKVCQRLVLLGGLFELIIGFVFFLIYIVDIADISQLGVNLAVVVMPAFYTIILEYFLLPLSVNTQKVMNEEMELDEER